MQFKVSENCLEVREKLGRSQEMFLLLMSDNAALVSISTDR